MDECRGGGRAWHIQVGGPIGQVCALVAFETFLEASGTRGEIGGENAQLTGRK